MFLTKKKKKDLYVLHNEIEYKQIKCIFSHELYSISYDKLFYTLHLII